MVALLSVSSGYFYEYSLIWTCRRNAADKQIIRLQAASQWTFVFIVLFVSVYKIRRVNQAQRHATSC